MVPFVGPFVHHVASQNHNIRGLSSQIIEEQGNAIYNHHKTKSKQRSSSEQNKGIKQQWLNIKNPLTINHERINSQGLTAKGIVMGGSTTNQKTHGGTQGASSTYSSMFISLNSMCIHDNNINNNVKNNNNYQYSHNLQDTTGLKSYIFPFTSIYHH